MQQLRRNTVSRAVSYVLMLVLLAPQSLFLMPAGAQTAGQNVPAVAVIPFCDGTGKAGAALMREATAAAALALEDSKEYVVISTTDLDREMAALHMVPPLSLAQQIRLGQRLHADKVLIGTLADLGVDCATGRARASLNLMLLDVAIGEYLDGAMSSIETKAVPGFTGDVAAVTHEALREVAETAVNKMLSSTVRRGTVELVDDQGTININLGTDDGLEIGNELLVMRPTWQPDVEQVIMRRVGIIRLTDVESDLSIAKRVEGALPTTGDRLYRVYQPASVQEAVARQAKIKSGLTIVAGVLLLLGLVAVATGPTTASSSHINAGLAQAQPGADPVVRLDINTGTMQTDKTHGWLIFRAANNPDFPALAQYLIDAIPGQSLRRYSDEPFQFRVVEDFSITFTFIVGGDQQDGDCTVSFNDEPLVRGTRYFYRVKRIITPVPAPGSNPPIGTGQVVPTTPVITTTPDDSILSKQSNAAGPVTFFTPPVLSSPDAGSTSLRPDSITFTWATTVGADEYQVQVFPEDDPNGIGAPILQSRIIHDTGLGTLSTTLTGFSGLTTYWWRVGARNSGDPVLPLNTQTNKRGFLYSAMRDFTTAQTPPPPPGTGAASIGSHAGATGGTSLGGGRPAHGPKAHGGSGRGGRK